MKNVPLISIAFFLLIVSSANGQVRFEKTYGGLDSDFGSSVKQTLDGGYILFGATESYGAAVRDWYLIKTDEFGEELWSKTYGGAAFDHGWDIAQTADTGYILVGNKSHHSFLIKTNSVGDTMWTRAYEGSIFSVQQTLDGGYLLGGSISFVVGNYDMLLIKIKADGEHEWTKNYGSMRGDDCRDVAQTTDGGFVLVGHAWGGMSMVKTDSFGDVLWTRSYGGFEGFSVKQTSDGGFILLGDSTVNGIGSFHVVKTDSIGRTIWAKLFYKGNMYYSGYEVAQTPDNGYVFVGELNGMSSPNNRICLVKMDSMGDALWTRTYTPGSGTSLDITSDGGFAILGLTYDDEVRLHDLFLIKTDSNGISPSASTDSSNLELPEVIDIHKKIETTVCPNPFTNFTTIKIENSIFKNLDLVLFDARGRLVKKAINNSNDRFIIKREGLASGLYFFQVTTGKQVIGRGKLMVK